jgi:hypothetical protein
MNNSTLVIFFLATLFIYEIGTGIASAANVGRPLLELCFAPENQSFVMTYYDNLSFLSTRGYLLKEIKTTLENALLRYNLHCSNVSVSSDLKTWLSISFINCNISKRYPNGTVVYNFSYIKNNKELNLVTISSSQELFSKGIVYLSLRVCPGSRYRFLSMEYLNYSCSSDVCSTTGISRMNLSGKNVSLALNITRNEYKLLSIALLPEALPLQNWTLSAKNQTKVINAANLSLPPTSKRSGFWNKRLLGVIVLVATIILLWKLRRR